MSYERDSSPSSSSSSSSVTVLGERPSTVVTAFQCFLAVQKKELTRNNSRLGIAQIWATATDLWNELNAEGKAPYVQKADLLNRQSQATEQERIRDHVEAIEHYEERETVTLPEDIEHVEVIEYREDDDDSDREDGPMSEEIVVNREISGFDVFFEEKHVALLLDLRDQSFEDVLDAVIDQWHLICPEARHVYEARADKINQDQNHSGGHQPGEETFTFLLLKILISFFRHFRSLSRFWLRFVL